MVVAAKKAGMKQPSDGDVETGPLLDKEPAKQAITQESSGKILGVPTQLAAGIFYCCGMHQACL